MGSISIIKRIKGGRLTTINENHLAGTHYIIDRGVFAAKELNEHEITFIIFDIQPNCK